MRLERMVILRGDILGAACALDRAKDCALHWERKTSLRAPVLDQAIRGADKADERAFIYYRDLL